MALPAVGKLRQSMQQRIVPCRVVGDIAAHDEVKSTRLMRQHTSGSLLIAPRQRADGRHRRLLYRAGMTRNAMEAVRIVTRVQVEQRQHLWQYHLNCVFM